MNLAKLNDMIAAVCPIDGINSDGVIWFKSEATTEQKQAAQALMDAYLHDADAPAVPEVVTMRQARLALLQAGLLTQVNTAVANMPGVAGDMARIEWEFSSSVERNRPLVQSLISVLGLSESQLDDLFQQAATL